MALRRAEFGDAAVAAPGSSRDAHLVAFVISELQREAIWWLPLRVFLGVGWLRAAAEKLVQPEWFDGSSLSAFLLEHLPRAAFPGYARLIEGVFLPLAAPLGLLVMIAQLLVGLCLLLGWYTRVGLTVGLLMNFNFVAAGEPNPSAFYLVMQMALLSMNPGRILGMDRLLRRRAPRPARPAPSPQRAVARLWAQMAALAVLAAFTLYSFTQIRDFSAAGSIKDPAAILCVLGCMALAYGLIATLRALIAPPAQRPSAPS